MACTSGETLRLVIIIRSYLQTCAVYQWSKSGAVRRAMRSIYFQNQTNKNYNYLISSIHCTGGRAAQSRGEHKCIYKSGRPKVLVCSTFLISPPLRRPRRTATEAFESVWILSAGFRTGRHIKQAWKLELHFRSFLRRNGVDTS